MRYKDLKLDRAEEISEVIDSIEDISEIAFVAGQLLAEGEISFAGLSEKDRLTNVYLPIYESWQIIHRKKHKHLYFLNKEEEVSLSLYSRRVLVEGYNKQKRNFNR